jgi:hypothetical protein
MDDVSSENDQKYTVPEDTLFADFMLSSEEEEFHRKKIDDLDISFSDILHIEKPLRQKTQGTPRHVKALIEFSF